MADLAHPHDRFFKSLMASPKVAEALFRERLPRELVEELADAPPEPVESELVDAHLRGSSADGLFRLWLRGRRPLFVYSLVEHKSAPEPRVALQLLGYMVRIWESEKLGQGARKKLLGIVPMVLYHGLRPWTVPASFLELVDLERALWPRPLDFGIVVVDLGVIEDERLSRDLTLRAGLLGLKYATRADQQRSKLRNVLAALKQAPSFIAPGFAYIMGAYKQIDRAELLGEVREVMPEYEGELMSIAAREWMAEGQKQGREEGQKQGRRDSLLRLLERRFGRLPEQISERAAAGSAEEVDAWFDKAVDAATLDAVFGRMH